MHLFSSDCEIVCTSIFIYACIQKFSIQRWICNLGQLSPGVHFPCGELFILRRPLWSWGRQHLKLSEAKNPLQFISSKNKWHSVSTQFTLLAMLAYFWAHKTDNNAEAAIVLTTIFWSKGFLSMRNECKISSVCKISSGSHLDIGFNQCHNKQNREICLRNWHGE